MSEERKRTVARIEDGILVTRSEQMKKDNDAAYQQQVRQSLSIVSSLGLSITLPMLLGLFIGRWIDKAAQTESTFTLIFLGIGLFVGISNVIILLIRK